MQKRIHAENPKGSFYLSFYTKYGHKWDTNGAQKGHKRDTKYNAQRNEKNRDITKKLL